MLGASDRIPIYPNTTINAIFEDPREFLNEKDGNIIKHKKARCPQLNFKIENIKVKALVDTGRAVSCISEDLCKI